MSATANTLALVPSTSANCPVLTMLEGAESSRTWRLGERPLVLGRDLANEVPIGDAKASRQHARLTWTNAQVPGSRPLILAEDLCSTNGTFVNGHRIARPTLLGGGDKLVVGDSLFCLSLGVDEALEEQRRLIQHATTDGLTALCNREMFERTVRREYERSRRYGRPISLVMFDLDDAHALAMSFGHAVGDLVLRQVGRIVRDNLRIPDFGARVGDDAFAALLPETPVDGAAVMAERLRAHIERFPMVVGEHPLHVTISAAVGGLDGSFAHADAWIEAVAATLEEARTDGRNRVVVRG